MAHYLIEFRFFGKAKYEMKQLIYDITRKFHLPHERAIPHTTLAGPLFTKNESRLIQDFKRICSESQFMNYEIDGFDTFKDSRVVFIRIKQSKKLDEFRWKLSQTIQPYCTLKPFDYKQDFEFHATLKMKLNHEKFNQIKNYVAHIKPPKYKNFMIRATLLKNKHILCEYDFLQRRALSRWEAKNRTELGKSMRLLKEFFAGKYAPDKNIRKSETITKETEQNIVENVPDSSNIHSKRHKYVLVPKKGIIRSILDSFQPSRTFLIADLHLNHYNILKFCNRPFNHDVNKMNQIIINNWNNTIRKKDVIFFLGDFDNSKPDQAKENNIKHLLPKLNGEIHFIVGNHDRYKHNREILHVLKELERVGQIKSVKESETFRYKNKEFYLVHDPKDIPSDWKGWSICGHHHNNKLSEFPFIDSKHKRINVGVELINYQPLDIEKLFELDYEHVEFMKDTDSQPRIKQTN